MTTSFKILRKRVDKDAAEVAAALGVSESAYRKYEISARIPQGKTLVLMKKVYKCTDEEIVAALKYHTKNKNN